MITRPPNVMRLPSSVSSSSLRRRLRWRTGLELQLQGGWRIKLSVTLLCTFSSLLVTIIPSSQLFAHAIPASPHPFRNVQPDGTHTTDLYMKGNEHFNYMTDSLGYTVLNDPTTKFDVYAIRDAHTGHAVPSQLRVGQIQLTEDDDLGVHRGFLLGPQKGGDPGKKYGLERGILPERWYHGVPNLDDVNIYEVKGEEGGIANNHMNISIPSLPWQKWDDKIRETCTSIFDCGRRKRGRQRYLRQSTLHPQTSKQAPRQRKLQSQQNAVGPHVTLGTLNNFVLLVRFTNHKNRSLPKPSEYEVFFNTVGGDPNLAPTGSVKDVYLASSHHQLTMQSSIFGWIDLPYSEAYYADNSSGTTVKLDEAIFYALSYLDKNQPKGFSWNTFDVNNDGKLDSVALIHSGYGAEWGGTDCFTNAKPIDRIWSHQRFTPSSSWCSSSSSSSKGVVCMDRSLITTGLWGVCGAAICHIGAVSHELGHMLGLSDLYDGVGNGGKGKGIGGKILEFATTWQYFFWNCCLCSLLRSCFRKSLLKSLQTSFFQRSQATQSCRTCGDSMEHNFIHPQWIHGRNLFWDG